MKRFSLLSLTLTIQVLVVSTIGLTAAPQLINYQGQLTDAGGTPLNGTVSIDFAIFDAVSGGNMIWSETQPSVIVTEGLFNVLLGSVTELVDTVFNDTSRYLTIKVGSDPPIQPRVRLVGAPYAFRVSTVDGSAGGTITGNVDISGKVTIGPDNINTGVNAFVAGRNNTASGRYSVVSGGGGPAAADSNSASANISTIGGGRGNSASEKFSTVGGGYLNLASDTAATVGGGSNNYARGRYSVIAGGGGPTEADSNSASAYCSSIGGGISNSASGSYSTVGGGRLNIASEYTATVGGGISNTAGGPASTVGGGSNNIASEEDATVGGGIANTASGYAATVPGGYDCEASGSSSFAAGWGAKAIHQASFVWSDYEWGNDFTSTADHQFNVRASGGVRIFTNFGLTAGVTMAAGASSWLTVSDRASKENIRPVDSQEILEKLSQLPVTRWNYKAQDESIEHIGPMAQDFYELFGLGEDDKHINTLDPDGVALAAIKALNDDNKELRRIVDELEQRLAELEKRD